MTKQTGRQLVDLDAVGVKGKEKLVLQFPFAPAICSGPYSALTPTRSQSHHQQTHLKQLQTFNAAPQQAQDFHLFLVQPFPKNI